jgi:hypothetical protein
MATAITLISSVTVGSGGAANIEFTSIPATYTDLLLKVSSRDGRAAATGSDLIIGFNASTANLTFKRIFGTGSAVVSDSGSFGEIGIENASTSTASTFSNVEVYIPNYAGSNNKSWSADSASENNATEAYLQFTAGLWSITSAITSIKLTAEAGASFVQYSTAYLYGISNA